MSGVFWTVPTGPEDISDFYLEDYLRRSSMGGSVYLVPYIYTVNGFLHRTPPMSIDKLGNHVTETHRFVRREGEFAEYVRVK